MEEEDLFGDGLFGGDADIDDDVDTDDFGDLLHEALGEDDHGEHDNHEDPLSDDESFAGMDPFEDMHLPQWPPRAAPPAPQQRAGERRPEADDPVLAQIRDTAAAAQANLQGMQQMFDTWGGQMQQAQWGWFPPPEQQLPQMPPLAPMGLMFPPLFPPGMEPPPQLQPGQQGFHPQPPAQWQSQQTVQHIGGGGPLSVSTSTTNGRTTVLVNGRAVAECNQQDGASDVRVVDQTVYLNGQVVWRQDQQHEQPPPQQQQQLPDEAQRLLQDPVHQLHHQLHQQLHQQQHQQQLARHQQLAAQQLLTEQQRLLQQRGREQFLRHIEQAHQLQQHVEQDMQRQAGRMQPNVQPHFSSRLVLEAVLRERLDALTEQANVARATQQDSLRQALQFSALRVCEEDQCREPCSVCLEDIVKGQHMRTLPCFHMFHQNCAEQYFEREAGRGETNITCPVCRCAVGPEVIDIADG